MVRTQPDIQISLWDNVASFDPSSELLFRSEAVWIDTVGYDDTNRLSDQSSFQEVLRFLDDHDLRDVRAIIWTVMPQERKDARLQKQAEFINLFKEGEV